MKNSQEDTTQNRIRDILTQIKLNREKHSKRLCSHNSIVGITFQIKQYKTRACKKKLVQHYLHSQLKTQIIASVECKKKKKCNALDISKAVLHNFEGRDLNNRSVFTKGKENVSASSTIKLNSHKISRKLRKTSRNCSERQKDNDRQQMKRDHFRSVSSKTQYNIQSKKFTYKPYSMHMRLRTDYQLLKPDIQGWKTEFDQHDINAGF